MIEESTKEEPKSRGRGRPKKKGVESAPGTRISTIQTEKQKKYTSKRVTSRQRDTANLPDVSPMQYTGSAIPAEMRKQLDKDPLSQFTSDLSSTLRDGKNFYPPNTKEGIISEMRAKPDKINSVIRSINRGRPYHPLYCDWMIEIVGYRGKSFKFFASYLGLTSDILQGWKKTYPKFKDAWELAHQISETFWEERLQYLMMDNKVNGSLVRFYLSNRFGWAEKKEEVVDQNISIRWELDPDKRTSRVSKFPEDRAFLEDGNNDPRDEIIENAIIVGEQNAV